MPSAPLQSIQPRDFRLLRQARGLSLAAAGAAAGIDASTLSRIENAQRPLTPALAIKLLRIYFPKPPAREPEGR